MRTLTLLRDVVALGYGVLHEWHGRSVAGRERKFVDCLALGVFELPSHGLQPDGLLGDQQPLVAPTSLQYGARSSARYVPLDE